MVNPIGFIIPKTWDSVLKAWWDHQWKKSKVFYNMKGTGNVDVRTALYTSASDYIELEKIVKPLIRENEDMTFKNIQAYVNARIIYVSDKMQYKKNEFWQDAYKTWQNKKGDCDDVAILIKVLTIIAGIPDYRVKCCCLDVYNPNGTLNGGHMNILYLSRDYNVWYFKEGTWRGGLKSYGRIWYTFNRENTWAQHSLVFDRSMMRKKIFEEVMKNGSND